MNTEKKIKEIKNRTKVSWLSAVRYYFQEKEGRYLERTDPIIMNYIKSQKNKKRE